MLIEKTITNKYKWIIWVKALILITCIVLIYFKLKDSEQFNTDFLDQLLLLTSNSFYTIIAVLLLMPVNWLMEAMKWRLLAKPNIPLTMAQAINGVASGLCLGFITPHDIGDYVGRLLSIEAESKGQLLGSIWLGHAMQMLVTFVFGMYGVSVFFSQSSIEFSALHYWWLIGLSLFVLIAIWLYYSKVKFFGRRVAYYFSHIKTYKIADYLLLLLLSSGRYMIFSFQYMLILRMFEIPLSDDVLFAGVSWMFLAKSIIPSFNFLSDLGVRELSTLTFFDLYEVSQPAVLSSSLLLWLINIFMPVLIGLYFVFNIKIQPKRD